MAWIWQNRLITFFNHIFILFRPLLVTTCCYFSSLAPLKYQNSGAAIKKQTHTLSIITESRAITLAFNYSSTLIQWDAWLRQNFHESNCFFQFEYLFYYIY